MVVLAAVRSADAQDTQLYWGDTHLHTSYSTDAYSGGNLTADPDVAYRYAKGLPVIHPTTRTRMRIARPLDFLVVADHADLLGFQAALGRDDARLLASPVGQRLRALQEESPGRVFRLIQVENGDITLEQILDLYEPIEAEAWIATVDAAERHYEPGVFTSFAGWEWSSTPGGANLHRVVFTPAPADALRSIVPFSSYDSARPEDLWAWLEKTAAALDTSFVAIPHNSNMSTGLMFDRVDSAGRPISADYARTRMRWEPVVEMTQVKGTSEAHPALAPNDEFADFEIFKRLFSSTLQATPNAGDYARSALLRGLEFEEQIGVNPFKLGMIGSSDIHVGLSATDEDNFLGAVANGLTPEERRQGGGGFLQAWNISAAGLAAVWATANTREDLAAAFRRKEVYATTGTRIELRVFGGFDFAAADAAAADLAAVGYARGVPMGGDLADGTSARPPALLIHAVKDPEGANLDRVQVVKGWLDAGGATHEHIYNVAWSGKRTLRSDGSLEPVGDTVDLTRASFANSIGAAQLAVVWNDPDFDPDRRAFYYARVLEIPTPRHQVYDAVALGMDPAETGQPTRIQERAYSSPIWYTP